MARAPNEKVESALKLYRKGAKLIDIAAQLGLPEGTVRRWKCVYKWDSERSEKSERSHKRGPPYGSKNALGNKGGRPPAENKNAEKHGLFSKWLPDETREILGEVSGSDPLDLLWDNIRLQYAAIVRAQKIMHVKSQEDMTKELKREKETETGWEKEYELQFAWDKQASFLQAQSRAMKTLEGMIKQYDEMLHRNWDLATEEQKARIESLRAKTPADESAESNTGVVILPPPLPRPVPPDEVISDD